MKTRTIAVLVAALAGAAVYMVVRPAHTREQTDLPALQTAYRNADNASERAVLLHRVSALTDPGVARWLAEVAQTDSAAAVQASAAIGAITNKGEAGDLVMLAEGNAPIIVRANALRALGKAGGPHEAPAVAKLLEDPGQPLRVRQEAALALGSMHDTNSVGALVATIEAAPDPSNEQLRISAIQALGALGTTDARAFLTRYATGELSATERAFVSRAQR